VLEAVLGKGLLCQWEQSEGRVKIRLQVKFCNFWMRDGGIEVLLKNKF